MTFETLPRAERTKVYSWVAFHEANPHVYARMLVLCADWRRAGMDQWGPQGLINVLRYDSRVKTWDPAGRGVKLSNNDGTYYTRLIMGLMPEVGMGVPDFWRCCEHSRDKHVDGECRGCWAIGERHFAALYGRTIMPSHPFAPGLFECKSAMVDTRWARSADRSLR